ncbi:hypothetical protein TSOC_004388 [Tetrabaena socialis]|uniref:SET domain-containing protein n=1 Tax=Tetrabaena socialis TaxID=47790 RepID=A0A2J8A939_9CHLO|nr:hypothetical protein TSOC_004388 [Tetrabaena socialis]|eukprot:PNH09046.1 hypothetical protein TSOC_004388 [Tetrabaena socialis]
MTRSTGRGSDATDASPHADADAAGTASAASGGRQRGGRRSAAAAAVAAAAGGWNIAHGKALWQSDVDFNRFVATKYMVQEEGGVFYELARDAAVSTVRLVLEQDGREWTTAFVRLVRNDRIYGIRINLLRALLEHLEAEEADVLVFSRVASKKPNEFSFRVRFLPGPRGSSTDSDAPPAVSGSQDASAEVGAEVGAEEGEEEGEEEEGKEGEEGEGEGEAGEESEEGGEAEGHTADDTDDSGSGSDGGGGERGASRLPWPPRPGRRPNPGAAAPAGGGAAAAAGTAAAVGAAAAGAAAGPGVVSFRVKDRMLVKNELQMTMGDARTLFADLIDSVKYGTDIPVELRDEHYAGGGGGGGGDGGAAGGSGAGGSGADGSGAGGSDAGGGPGRSCRGRGGRARGRGGRDGRRGRRGGRGGGGGGEVDGSGRRGVVLRGYCSSVYCSQWRLKYLKVWLKARGAAEGDLLRLGDEGDGEEEDAGGGGGSGSGGGDDSGGEAGTEGAGGDGEGGGGAAAPASGRAGVSQGTARRGRSASRLAAAAPQADGGGAAGGEEAHHVRKWRRVGSVVPTLATCGWDDTCGKVLSQSDLLKQLVLTRGMRSGVFASTRRGHIMIVDDQPDTAERKKWQCSMGDNDEFRAQVALSGLSGPESMLLKHFGARAGDVVAFRPVAGEAAAFYIRHIRQPSPAGEHSSRGDGAPTHVKAERAPSPAQAPAPGSVDAVVAALRGVAAHNKKRGRSDPGEAEALDSAGSGRRRETALQGQLSLVPAPGLRLGQQQPQRGWQQAPAVQEEEPQHTWRQLAGAAAGADAAGGGAERRARHSDGGAVQPGIDRREEEQLQQPPRKQPRKQQPQRQQQHLAMPPPTSAAAAAAAGAAGRPPAAAPAGGHAAHITHLHGYLPSDMQRPAPQEGELRLCGQVFAPSVAPQVRAAMLAVQAGVTRSGRLLADLIPETEQMFIPGVDSASDVPAAAGAAAWQLAPGPWVDEFRRHGLLRPGAIRARLADRLGLTSENGYDAALPPGPIDTVGVQPGPDLQRGGMGLFATGTIRPNSIPCVLAGYVLEQLPAGGAFAARGCKALPAATLEELRSRMAGSELEGEGRPWRFLVKSFSLPLLPHSGVGPAPAVYEGVSPLSLSMLGYGNLAALVNDPRVNPWEPLDSAANAEAAKAVNCMIVPVFVRGLLLLALVAVREIKPGEQLLRDYGDAWWRGLEELEEYQSSAAAILHGQQGGGDAMAVQQASPTAV